MSDLVYRDGHFYKKFTDVPFTGTATGEGQGSFKNEKKDDPWVSYHKNGQLDFKGTRKNGKKDGPWVRYYDNGQLWFKGTYKDGKRDGFFRVIMRMELSFQNLQELTRTVGKVQTCCGSRI